MSTKQQVSTFKKSLLSVIGVSMVTGGLIAFEKSQRLPQTVIENPLHQAILHSTAAVNTAQDKRLSNLTHNLEKKTGTTSAEQSAQALLFAFDSYQIKPAYYALLTNTAQLIKASEQGRWQVVGYTDPSGNTLYNRKLGQKRAQAVADFLISQGVNQTQLSVISLGATQVDKKVGDSAALRRVEILPYQTKSSELAAWLKSKQSNAASLRKDNKQAQKVTAQHSLPISFALPVKPLATAIEL